jgi:hypothetical protein
MTLSQKDAVNRYFVHTEDDLSPETIPPEETPEDVRDDALEKLIMWQRERTEFLCGLIKFAVAAQSGGNNEIVKLTADMHRYAKECEQLLQEHHEKDEEIYRDVRQQSEEQRNPQLLKALFVLYKRQRDMLYVLESFIEKFMTVCIGNAYWHLFDLYNSTLGHRPEYSVRVAASKVNSGNAHP